MLSWKGGNIYVVAMLCLLLLMGCSGGQYVPLAQFPSRVPIIESISKPTSSIKAGDEAELTVTWSRGTAPYQIVWEFTGGSSQELYFDRVEVGEGMSHTIPVKFVETGDPDDVYFCRIRITDLANGQVTDGFSFTVD